jgi:hypothetical protein
MTTKTAKYARQERPTDYIIKAQGLTWVYRPNVVEVLKSCDPNWEYTIGFLSEINLGGEGKTEFTLHGANLKITRRGRKVTVELNSKKGSGN